MSAPQKLPAVHYVFYRHTRTSLTIGLLTRNSKSQGRFCIPIFMVLLSSFHHRHTSLSQSVLTNHY